MCCITVKAFVVRHWLWCLHISTYRTTKNEYKPLVETRLHSDSSKHGWKYIAMNFKYTKYYTHINLNINIYSKHHKSIYKYLVSPHCARHEPWNEWLQSTVNTPLTDSSCKQNHLSINDISFNDSHHNLESFPLLTDNFGNFLKYGIWWRIKTIYISFNWPSFQDKQGRPGVQSSHTLVN